MKLLTSPAALPYKCFSCGAGGSDRKYMDTEIDIDFYGVVYICEFCFVTWFENWQSPNMKALHETVTQLSTRIEELESERATLLDAVRISDNPSVTGISEPPVVSENDSKAKSKQGSDDRETSPLSF